MEPWNISCRLASNPAMRMGRLTGLTFGLLLACTFALAQSGTEMSVLAIRAQVEALLGGSVSRFSVSDYLLTRSRGPKPLFIRMRRGHYRLVSGKRAGTG